MEHIVVPHWTKFVLNSLLTREERTIGVRITYWFFLKRTQRILRGRRVLVELGTYSTRGRIRLNKNKNNSKTFFFLITASRLDTTHTMGHHGRCTAHCVHCRASTEKIRHPAQRCTAHKSFFNGFTKPTFSINHIATKQLEQKNFIKMQVS